MLALVVVDAMLRIEDDVNKVNKSDDVSLIGEYTGE